VDLSSISDWVRGGLSTKLYPAVHSSGLGNVVDQFHYEYRLTNTVATKQANLPATLKYGLQESTTLMPVSKMARVVSKST
jgi:hypothetical protein